MGKKADKMYAAKPETDEKDDGIIKPDSADAEQAGTDGMR